MRIVEFRYIKVDGIIIILKYAPYFIKVRLYLLRFDYMITKMRVDYAIKRIACA